MSNYILHHKTFPTYLFSKQEDMDTLRLKQLRHQPTSSYTIAHHHTPPYTTLHYPLPSHTIQHHPRSPLYILHQRYSWADWRSFSWVALWLIGRGRTVVGCGHCEKPKFSAIIIGDMVFQLINPFVKEESLQN